MKWSLNGGYDGPCCCSPPHRTDYSETIPRGSKELLKVRLSFCLCFSNKTRVSRAISYFNVAVLNQGNIRVNINESPVCLPFPDSLLIPKFTIGISIQFVGLAFPFSWNYSHLR